MRFKDPLDITCPSCQTISLQSPRELLEDLTRCPNCNASLKDIGVQMRITCDDFSAYLFWIELAMEIEVGTGIVISDDDLFGIRHNCAELTIRDMIGLVAEQMPTKGASSDGVLQVVLDATSALVHQSVELKDIDRPVLQLRMPTPILGTIAR